MCVRECFSLWHLTCNRYSYTRLLKRVNNKSKNYVHIKTKLQGKCFKGTICIFFISAALSISARREERRKREVSVLSLTLALSVRHYSTLIGLRVREQNTSTILRYTAVGKLFLQWFFFSFTNNLKWKLIYINMLLIYIIVSQNLWRHHTVFFTQSLKPFLHQQTQKIALVIFRKLRSFQSSSWDQPKTLPLSDPQRAVGTDTKWVSSLFSMTVHRGTHQLHDWFSYFS